MLKTPVIEKVDFKEIVETGKVCEAILNEAWPGFREDYLVLHFLIKKYSPDSFFEIGTSEGRGTRVICNAMKGKPVYSLELPSPKSGNQMVAPRNPGWRCEFEYKQILGDSLEYPYDPCEGYFIDGNHIYENVFKESTKCFELSPKLIVWHDIQVSGIKQAIVNAAPDWYKLYECSQTRIAWAIPKPVVVYTAISNDFDNLSEIIYPPAVAYVDKKIDSKWDTRALEGNYGDARRNAKFPKICPHRIMDAEYSLWIDGNLDLLIHPRHLLPYLKNCDVATPTHPFRSCVYLESKEIIKNKLDDIKKVEKQVERYRSEGFRSNWLPWCGLILRRHTEAVQEFNDLWWAEIQANSVRDQLSYPYIAEESGIQCSLQIPRHFLQVRCHKED